MIIYQKLSCTSDISFYDEAEEVHDTFTTRIETTAIHMLPAVNFLRIFLDTVVGKLSMLGRKSRR